MGGPYSEILEFSCTPVRDDFEGIWSIKYKYVLVYPPEICYINTASYITHSLYSRPMHNRNWMNPL